MQTKDYWNLFYVPLLRYDKTFRAVNDEKHANKVKIYYLPMCDATFFVLLSLFYYNFWKNCVTSNIFLSIKSSSGSWERLPLFSLNSSTKYFISRMSCVNIFSLFCCCEKGVKYLWLVIKTVTRFWKLWKWSLNKMCDHDSWQFNIFCFFSNND